MTHGPNEDKSSTAGGGFAPEIHETRWAEWIGQGNGLSGYLASKIGIDELILDGATNDTDYAFDVEKELEEDIAFPFDLEKTMETGLIHVWELYGLMNWAASEGHIEAGHWVIVYSV